MGGMECVITGLMDEFHDFFHGRKYAREVFTLCAVCVSFSVALVNVTPVSSFPTCLYPNRERLLFYTSGVESKMACNQAPSSFTKERI